MLQGLVTEKASKCFDLSKIPIVSLNMLFSTQHFSFIAALESLDDGDDSKQSYECALFSCKTSKVATAKQTS